MINTELLVTILLLTNLIYMIYSDVVFRKKIKTIEAELTKLENRVRKIR